MAITRGQMNREMYGLGSYFPPENGREKFGLGSKLKKFVRNIIPNEVSKIAVQAAPFVAPFNPLLAGYMAGIGGFDQTGRIGSSLKRGLLTYGGGQLARQLGGAGFQEGFNPFSNVSFTGGIMSGLGQTFTSPVSGAPMFGQASFAPDPNQAIVSSTPTQQAITSGAADIDQYGGIQDYLAKTDPSQLSPAQRASEIAQQAGKTFSEKAATEVSRGYGDIFKDLISGDFTKMGNAATELGGKALKDIYTQPITNAAGEVTGSKLDKTALLATLVTIPSYLDAKKAADEAGLEEFDEATYNAERDKYMSRYQTNLPASSFGIQQAANGGRIGYKEGTPREGIVSLTDEDSGVIYRDEKGNPISKEEWLRLTAEEEFMSPTDQGSGVIYRDEQGNPISKEEWLRLTSEAPSLTLPEKETKGMKKSNYKSDPYLLQLMRKTGEDVFFFGEPNPELNYREFDKMPMDYQNKVEDKREERRRYYQDPENYSPYQEYKAPRYERMANGGITTGIRNKYAMGSEVPVRRNQGGISELDYRNTGGFVPIGVKEKADDVPAMLSKNEFVFTADAVRAAGGGSINKGAQRMYKTMKALENKVV